MRLLTPLFLDAFKERVINIHPALLPKYPGTHGIQDSYASKDREMGITIHRVNEGMDTGPIIKQVAFTRHGTEPLDRIEERIHRIEHETYPSVLIELLDEIEAYK
jgi:phosphoribosylglycinamide formyltransferase-1